MKNTVFTVVFVFNSLLICLNAMSQSRPIGFVEDFVLNENREAALKKLIPGTEEYYYFHCLHYQNSEQFDKVDELLKTWIKRTGQTSLVKQIRNRQALLTYNQDPQATLDYLRRELGLRFDHQREIPKAELELPSELDPKLINLEVLAKNARKNHSNTQGFTDFGLQYLLNQEPSSLDERELTHLLERLRQPDALNLVELVDRQLKTRSARPFGQLEIHRQMTLEQLNELKKRRPGLLNEKGYVDVYLTKLRPNDDESPAFNRIDYDEPELDRYLSRLESFVEQLDPVHNSLKAIVQYHRLRYDLNQGNLDRKKFQKYIELPRDSWLVEPKFIERTRKRQHVANVGANFAPMLLLPPIQNDELLVRQYLQHFFVEVDGWDQFKPWIRDDYLREKFAETKILNGLGDAEQWASLLTPEKFKEVVNRVEIEFALTNDKHFSVDQKVEFDLKIKNVETLIVKVFEINTFNYYKSRSREIETDINLDGLVPNWQKSFDYNSPPSLRVSRKFSLDEIKGPGVYVVDFIGNGVSSRALVRKGKLHFVEQPTSFGHEFRVFDWNNELVKPATLRIEGRSYSSDENGRIAVPFSNAPGQKTVVISSGEKNFSSLGYFQQNSESYQLDAGLYADRESLLKYENARLVINPSLTVSGVATDPSMLKNVSLDIKSIDTRGMVATKNVSNVQLNQNEETAVPFDVPPRTRSMTFTLSGTIESMSTGKEQTLSTSKTFSINEIESLPVIRDLHLVQSSDGYLIEVRDKNGLGLAKQAVLLKLQHDMVTEVISTSLQTDDRGQIFLGELEGIRSINAALPEVNRQWNVNFDNATSFASCHEVVGETIVVPCHPATKRQRSDIALFEIRENTIVADCFDKIKIASGSVLVAGLKPGDYSMHLRNENRIIRLRISGGKAADDIAFGKHRNLELRNQFPMVVRQISADDQKLTIKVSNASENARVHIFATRFSPRFDVYSGLGINKGKNPFHSTTGSHSTAYVAGRNIGDEYRYILERQLSKKFPGNMLERPSLLLRPWSIEVTENFRQSIAGDSDFDKVGMVAPSPSKSDLMRRQQQSSFADGSNLDFLAGGTSVLLNLKPDENGTITVNKEDLGLHFDLRIVAMDRQWVVSRSFQMDETALQRVDMRLPNSLDPEKHFASRKENATLSTGETLSIADSPTSKLEVFDDLSDVFQVLTSLSGDPTLSKFRFILDWPNKSNDEKRTLFSKYTCHELNYFIFKKDKDFFTNVVAPFISNKRDKTFVDLWLLELANIEQTEPWNYQRLNSVERILLGRTLRDETDAIARNIRDLYQLNPISAKQRDGLYDRVFFGRAMSSDTSVAFGIDSIDAKEKRLGQTRGGYLRGYTEVPRSEGQYQDQAGGESGGRPRRSVNRKNKKADAKPGKNSPADADNSLDDEEMDADEMRIMAKEELGKLDKRSEKYFKRVQGKDRNLRDSQTIREELKSLYRRLEPTRVWVETNYYHLPIAKHNYQRVPVNLFWLDYAESKNESNFLSPHFAQCASNFTEMMYAIAVLDLPFEAKKHDQKKDDQNLTLTASGPMIAFHQQVSPVVFERRGSTVLISENFFRNDDRYQTIDNKRYDKFVTDDFLTHVLYGGQVVVTNPTSTPNTIDVLIQIPQGSIPANNGQDSQSVKLDLAAFSTQTFEYYFYFPQNGDFEHYPAHVSDDVRVLAVAEAQTFRVLDEPKKIDKTSWAFVSQNGSDAEVIDFLNNNNTLAIDLSKIAFRLKDKSFFEKITSILDDRFSYNATLWSYAILHNSDEYITEFLRHNDSYVRSCGAYLDSPLINIDPIARRTYEHQEFFPLVNSRQHRLSRTREISNPKIWDQYHRWLNVLSCKNSINHEERLALVYYLLLQDRVELALEQFEKVERASVVTKMQYDYCRAYISMYREDTAVARQIAEKYSKYPVDLWREKFTNVLAQLDEIDGKEPSVVNKKDRDQSQTKLAAQTPAFDIKSESGKVVVTYQNLKEVKVNFYKMDIELLFSRNPFVKSQSGGFSYIQPNASKTVELPTEKPSFEIDIPDEFSNQNILVEVNGAGQSKSTTLLSSSLDVKISEAYGQFRVTNAQTQKPMSKVYAKVYVRTNDGKIKFFKDGYTDLRGRFDYASTSNQSLDGVSEFSILILSESDGAVVRQAKPPTE